MALNITDEMRKRYENYLKIAEPYTDEELDAIPYDAHHDYNRMNATMAKKLFDAEKNPNIKCQRDIFR